MSTLIPLMCKYIEKRVAISELCDLEKAIVEARIGFLERLFTALRARIPDFNFEQWAASVAEKDFEEAKEWLTAVHIPIQEAHDMTRAAFTLLYPGE